MGNCLKGISEYNSEINTLNKKSTSPDNESVLTYIRDQNSEYKIILGWIFQNFRKLNECDFINIKAGSNVITIIKYSNYIEVRYPREINLSIWIKKIRREIVIDIDNNNL